MGFGDFLEEQLNRVPGVGSLIETEEEKRRKKRKKKKRPQVPKTSSTKKKDEYSWSDLAKDAFIPGRAFEKIASPALEKIHAPKIVRSIPKNIAEMGAGFIPAAGAVGRAAWHDRNVSLLDMLDSKDDLQNFLELAKWTAGYGKKKTPPKTDSELAGITALVLRAWGQGIEKSLPNVTDWDDVKEAGRHWRDEPVFALMDLLPIASAVSRPASIGRLGTQIARANEISKTGAFKAAVRESYRPGSARAGGLKGGIAPRTHTADLGQGDVTVAGRPLSRNPLMREFQGIYDNIFEASESLSRKRVGRIQERGDREAKRQITLETQELTGPLAHVIYGKLGRTLGAFGLKKSMNPAERRRATAIAYIFQNKKGISFDRTLAAVQDDLSRQLQDGFVEYKRGRHTKRDPLSEDDKRNLAIQISDLDMVRQELRSGKLSEDELRGALEQFKNIADKNTELGELILQDFKGMAGDDLAELLGHWDDRANILHTRLVDRGYFTKVEDSASRRKWKEWLTDHFGEEQANEGVALADGLAQTARPHDPASWWEERVGSPDDMLSWDDFQSSGRAALFSRPGRRQIVGTASHDLFYSPLQKWVAEEMPKRMPAKDLQNVILKKIPKEEFYNAGLDLYFDSIPEDALIHKLDFQDHLNNPLNAYNLEEQLLVYGGEGEHATAWDKWGSGSLMSRDPAPGEYSELFMRLPGEGRDVIRYGGKGYEHWKHENVIAHVRWHIFEEDGVVKLVIDEIQSDWASDARRAKKSGEEYRGTPTDDEIREIQMLQDRSDGIAVEIDGLRDEIYRVTDELRNKDLPEERDPLLQQLDDLRSREQDLRDAYYDAREGMEALGKRGIPPSPLGEKYYRAILRRVMREAAEEGVDEIVLVDGTTQAARNSFHHDLMKSGDAHPSDIRTSYVGEDLGAFGRLYGEVFPSFLAKEYGLKGEYTRAAYRGRYSTQGGQFSMNGDMPGMRFPLTEEAKAQALRPQPLYQIQPNWSNIPKGANELLANGDRLIHMFESSDISTWIHELSHSALYDLDVDDLATIQRELAGGKVLDQWSNADHERFARAFEQYMKDGKAPSPELATSFQRISQWMTEIWNRVKESDVQISDDVRDVFDRMVAPHADADKPWGYFPHRDFAEMANQDYRGGTRPPATGQTIGVPRLAGDTLQNNKNELIRYQTGRLAVDPMQLVDVYLKRLRFTETLRARREMWENGTPLSEGQPPADAWLVRNPDAPASRIHPETRAAVRGDDLGREADVGEEDLVMEPEDFRKEIVARVNEHPRWARDEENVRWVHGDYVKSRFEDVFNEKPRGSLSSGLAMLNSLQRITGIYGRPVSYVGGNIPFNVMALVASAPVSSLMHMGEAFTMRKRNPLLYRLIASEGGETRAGAGLPDFYTRGNTRAQRAERATTGVQRGIADKLSGIADTPFRVTAFLNNARKLGYKTEREIEDLIKDGGHDLADIRQRTREQMLDFDALNPAQRRLASNLFYLWPFIYASIKWPAMFTREYPARAAAAANLFKEENENAPQAIANLWQKYGVDLATFNPLGPAADIAETGQALLEDPSRMDLTVLQERLSPTIAALVEGMGGGSKNALQNYIRQTVPLAAEFYSKDPQFRGGKVYEDRSRMAYLLQRHLRFFPRGVNKEVVKERIEEFRKDQISGTTHELEMEADKQKLRAHIKEIGGYSEEDGQLIVNSYNAWWAYQEAVDEKKDSTGQRKLTNPQQANVLADIIEEYFPDAAPYLKTAEQVEKMSDEDADYYVDAVKKHINEGRTMVFDDYRSYAAP